MASENLIKAVLATAEVMGTELTEAGAEMMCNDLAEYTEVAVLMALTKCRREITGRRLTLADVVKRIDDGRPGPNEAWAMLPRSERETVVWTEEMAFAAASAQPLLEAGDHVAARLAFIEHYEREVAQSSAERKPVKWIPNLGWDKSGREPAVRRAVELGQLTATQARKLLPHGTFEETEPAVPRISGHGPIEIKKLLPELTK